MLFFFLKENYGPECKYVRHLHEDMVEARRGHQIPGNRSYSDMSHLLLWVLGTEPGSSARVTSFLNCPGPYYPSFLIRTKFYEIPKIIQTELMSDDYYDGDDNAIAYRALTRCMVL